MTPQVGDEDYKKHLPFFRSVCSKYVRPGVEMDDLLQMCFFGLYNALASWEGKGEFGAFLNVCVKHAIYHGLDEPGAYNTIGERGRKTLGRFMEAKDKLSRLLGRVPSNLDLAQELGTFPERIAVLERYSVMLGLVPLDEPIAEDEEGGTVLDFLAADDDGALNRVELDELRRVLWPIVKSELSDKTYKIVRGRISGKTNAELAAELGEPTKRTKAAYERSLDKLRRNRDIKRLAQDYGFYRHVSLSEFRRTRTSSVEAEVIRREEQREGKHGKRVREEVL